MESYTELADLYDTFMDNVPYEDWMKRIQKVLKKENINDGLLLDLGCGTGTLTEMLAKAGFDLIGIDNSSAMLQKAQEKTLASGSDILYLNQDMRAFELFGTVRGIICICDAVNYILDPEELLEVFRLVNNYLDPEGVFLFDFNTKTKYKRVGSQTIAEDREDCAFIWDNYYDEKEAINEYALTLFKEVAGGLYEREMEVHYQRGYTLEEIRDLIERSGLRFVSATDETNGPVTKDSERIFVVAREHGKTDRIKRKEL